MSGTIDRSLPRYRDDPVISRLTDEEVRAVAGLMARLASGYAQRRERDTEQARSSGGSPVAIGEPETERSAP